MFMESPLDDGLEHCVRDTVLPPPPLLGRSAEPARKRPSRGPRPRPRDEPVDPWIDQNSPRMVPALSTAHPTPIAPPQPHTPPTTPHIRHQTTNGPKRTE